MNKIMIAGDSWGCGEWNVTCDQILHRGIETYFTELGHNVVNVSKGGCSNLDTVNRIKLWIDKFGADNVELIYVFQTEYSRDFKHSLPEDWNINSFSDLSDIWLARFYTRLSEISQTHSCQIKIIGGCCDTLWFDNMNQDYPGCEIVCQSMTNLLINDDPSIQVPVLSWYDKHTEPLLQKAREKDIDLEQILEYMNSGFERESTLRENPKWFFPDGKHANRSGHLKLFEFLISDSISS
jgi:hypothetical protein